MPRKLTRAPAPKWSRGLPSLLASSGIPHTRQDQAKLHLASGLSRAGASSTRRSRPGNMIRLRPMISAYASAARRMHDHARQLSSEPRMGTADHLYGMAAECALKAILHAYNVIPAAPRKPAKPFSVHIDRLWQEYAAWAAGHGAYTVPRSSPFGRWRVEDRYRHDDDFDAARLHAHREGASMVAKLLGQAIVDGVVR